MIEQELAEARRGVDEVEHGLRESESKRSSIEVRVQSVRGELERARVDMQGLHVHAILSKNN